MSDELLPYYNSELKFVRELGAEFAEANPKIAARLGIGSGVAEDPHVGRLIEAFAYLNARTRHKLDDDFPELTEAMLGVLYPHYLAPIPSLSIVQFSLDRTQAELKAGFTVPRGAGLETLPTIEGEGCRFRTAYSVTVFPIELTAASYKAPPFIAPRIGLTGDAPAIVRLALSGWSPKMTFQQLAFDRLRFYLKEPAPYIYTLYELLLNNALGVILASSPQDENPVVLPKSCLGTVGFERDEALLEYPPGSFLGYRLLSEYFALPQKFLFFDVLGLTPAALSRLGNKLDIYIPLNKHVSELERHITKDTFQMGCTPAVNLFKKRAEPIRLTQTMPEYRVAPDSRRPLAHEVYSIDKVVATSPDQETREFMPFYGVGHGGSDRHAFWHSMRRPSMFAAGQLDKATEVYLSLVDLDFKVSAPADWTLDVETTCLNRNLPARLPFGGGQPRLQLSQPAPLVSVSCLTRPTPTLRPALRKGTLWRLISHLSLNHLSLVEPEQGAAALRDILLLYDYVESAETRGQISGLVGVQSRRVVGRSGDDEGAGFCRGLEVGLQFDEDKFTGAGVYLFAAVLERFLGLYCSINSFTRTVASTNQREEILCRWPPRAGETVLL